MAAAPPVPTTTATPSPHLRVPRSFDQVFKLTRYQLREYVSSRRFVVLLAIVAAIGAIITLILVRFADNPLVHGLRTNPLAFYGSFWGGGAGGVIVLAAVIFGGDAIAGEFQNKTGYFLMGLPIRRTTVYVGKYIAAFVASTSVLILYLAILLGNGAFYLGTGVLPWQLGPSFLLALVYLAAVLGATFMFSSLFKTSAYGFVLTAILFLFGFSLLQTLITALVKIEPWMVISYASAAVGNVFGASVNWGLTPTVSTGILGTSYTPGVAEGVVIMLGYFLLSALAGLFLFDREEFT